MMMGGAIDHWANITSRAFFWASKHSRPAVLRVPMPLEIQDQRGAEMAVCLLAGEDSSIVEELANRFLCHTECTPVSDGADDVPVCEPVNHSGKRCIHLIRLHDCVADQPSFRAVTVEPPPEHDCLPCDAVTGKALQSHVRG